MMLIRSVVLLTTLLPALLTAGNPRPDILSRAEIHNHLLGPGLSSDRQNNYPSHQETARSRKAPGLAAIYSLVLPGLGELYVGNYSTGKYFTIAEGVLWLTYAALDMYGNSLRDDARSFAAAHAGVLTGGKSNQYFVDIGNFIDIDRYNEKKLRDREPGKVYDPAAGYAWRWESDELRATYRAQRVKSEEMFNNRRFVIGAVIINHVASAINAARAAIMHNNALDEAFRDVDFHAEVLGGLTSPHGISLTISKRF
jgi:TM2 domain-containing membrane protein YozV